MTLAALAADVTEASSRPLKTAEGIARLRSSWGGIVERGDHLPDAAVLELLELLRRFTSIEHRELTRIARSLRQIGRALGDAAATIESQVSHMTSSIVDGHRLDGSDAEHLLRGLDAVRALLMAVLGEAPGSGR